MANNLLIFYLSFKSVNTWQKNEGRIKKSLADSLSVFIFFILDSTHYFLQ